MLILSYFNFSNHLRASIFRFHDASEITTIHVPWCFLYVTMMLLICNHDASYRPPFPSLSKEIVNTIQDCLNQIHIAKFALSFITDVRWQKYLQKYFSYEGQKIEKIGLRLFFASVDVKIRNIFGAKFRSCAPKNYEKMI